MISRNCALCAALLATACTGNTTRPESSRAAPSEEHFSACIDDEESLFEGSVQDDFGLWISVCGKTGPDLPEPQLAVRWSGEGGTDSVSCLSSKCGGIVEFSHYVRPRFTQIRMAWTKDGSVQRLEESYDAKEPGDEAEWHISHSWAERSVAASEVDSHAVRPASEPLSLLALGRFLPERPWSRPLLGSKLRKIWLGDARSQSGRR